MEADIVYTLHTVMHNRRTRTRVSVRGQGLCVCVVTVANEMIGIEQGRMRRRFLLLLLLNLLFLIR